ncbi:unnamed protein product [Linum tenue]|uniref:Uncharacterized protein n=1 Tax=Linum tenue TaxID=586396 RepID=A0AAV0K0P0_9ROSI|nr:unnamed protein product [Linum tenue]
MGLKCLLAILAVAVHMAGAAAVEAVELPIVYSVSNNALNTKGGIDFQNQIGEWYAKRSMSKATVFSWRAFNQLAYPGSKKIVPSIGLVVESMSEDYNGYAAYINGSIVHINANYLGQYNGDLKREFTGLVYNQVASILQWTGNGEAPAWLTTGMADYVRMKAGYEAVGWVGAGEGESLGRGFDVAAHFLGYCNKLKRGFVGELNYKMRNGYTVGYFVDLLGKNVDQLWSEYKATYAKRA